MCEGGEGVESTGNVWLLHTHCLLSLKASLVGVAGEASRSSTCRHCSSVIGSTFSTHCTHTHTHTHLMYVRMGLCKQFYASCMQAWFRSKMVFF